jgi:hypothetical protein
VAYALLPDPKALALDNIAVQEGIITLHIRTTPGTSACPECSACSVVANSAHFKVCPGKGTRERYSFSAHDPPVVLQQCCLHKEDFRGTG